MTLNELKNEFIKVAKRILKENISKDPNTLNTYKIDIIIAYNNSISYANSIWSNLTESEQNTVYSELLYIKTKFKECLGKLKYKYNLPENILIEVEETDIFLITELTNESDISLISEPINKPNMATSKIEFLRLCGDTIPNTFSGDPLHLKPFIRYVK